MGMEWTEWNGVETNFNKRYQNNGVPSGLGIHTFGKMV